MARSAPAALVAVLLVATALAFAYTEQLKLTPTPIAGTEVTKVFSPVCRCDTDAAVISFRLRDADRLDVELIDGRGTVVRHLIEGLSFPRGPVQFVWNGHDDADAIVPEGSYRPRIRLLRQRRTIVLPNPIRVDLTPPRIKLVDVAPRVFSPDGDGRGDRVVVRYRVDEPAQVSLYVDGRQRVRKRGLKRAGAIDWYGQVEGAPLSRGVYRLSVGAVDVAGNSSVRRPSRAVVIRSVALGRKWIETRPGARFAVLVSSDAARVDWQLGRRTGTAKPGTLRLRAPLQPGRFTLTVTAVGESARAAVIVRRPAP